MGRFLACTVLALASGCSAVPKPYGEGVTFHTALIGGYRAVDHPIHDGHPVYGLEFVTNERESGWGYELGGSYGYEDQSGPRSPSAEFNEVYLGLRRSWGPETGSARPYVGLGGAFTRVEHDLHDPRFEFEEEGGAAYLHGGVLWPLGPLYFQRETEVLLGLDLRGLVGDDYDYGQLSLVLGFGR